MTDNEVLDDITLLDYDFEDYDIGDDPSAIAPQIFDRTTAAAHNSTFTVVASGAGQELHIYKYDASTLTPAWSIAAPSSYQEHTLTWDFLFAGDDDQSRGFQFSAYGGSESYSYIAVQGKIMAYPASTFGFRLYNTSSPAFTIPISENVRYYVTLDMHGGSHTYDLYIRTSTGSLVGQAVGFPWYTYNDRRAGGITYYSWGAVNTETEGHLYVDNIQVTAPAHRIDMYPAYNATSSFTMQFDDINSGVYDNAFPYLSSIGYKAVTTVTVDYVGDPGHMSWSDLQDLSDAGWELAGHGVTHSDLPSLSYAAACAEISHTKSYIEANVTGCIVSTFAAPFNSWNVTLEMYARSVGYTSTPYSYFRHFYGPLFPATVNARMNWTSQGAGFNLVWWAHNVSAGAPRYSDDIYLSELMDLVNLTVEYGFSNWVTNNEAYQYSVDRELFDPVISELTIREVVFTSNIARPISVLIRADEGDAWQNGYWAATVDGVLTEVESVDYPILASQFVNVDDYESVSFQRLLTVTPVSAATVNVTSWTPSSSDSLMVWIAVGAASYTVYAASTLGYRIFQDDDVIATGTGPTFSFTAASGGEFNVDVWYERSVSVLIVLAVNMVGLGIFISLIGGFVMPTVRAIQNRKEIPTKVLMNDLMKAVVVIVVGLIMWRVLHEIAIG